MSGIFKKVTFIATALITCSAFGRQVDHIEDVIRLEGWPDYIREKQEFDRLRKNGVRDLEKQKVEEKKQIQEGLQEYKAEKAKDKIITDDTGPEFYKYLSDRKAWKNNHEEARHQYKQEIEKSRLRVNIPLSEEEELGLVPMPERVPYEKRTLFPKSARNDLVPAPIPRGNNNRNTWEGSLPPPPPPPPPEFYESDIPPPPDIFDGAPPPPPPMFEDEPPGY
jgi:hypothetical protein